MSAGYQKAAQLIGATDTALSHAKSQLSDFSLELHNMGYHTWSNAVNSIGLEIEKAQIKLALEVYGSDELNNELLS